MGADLAVIYQLRGVQHRYNGRTVLDLPALDIRRGEILAIVGPSGSGKSTLLRLLQFLEAPAAGSIIFDGFEIREQPGLDVRRRVMTVFQRPALLDRSVRDNVAFGLQLRGLRNVVVLGGGKMLQSGGTLVGAIGVSGAPGGAEDDRCAAAGIDAVREALEL